MKKILKIVLIFTFSLSLYSQQNDTIYGKLFYSENFKNQFKNIYVSEENSEEKVKVNQDGIFRLNPRNNKDNYILFIYINKRKIKEYTFKSEWANKNRPKSISIPGECKINTKTAQTDWKNKKAKIFIYQKTINEKSSSKKDKRIEKKYKFKYIFFNENLKNYDCYLRYNERILLSLRLTYSSKILSKLRTDIVGYE